MVDDKFCEDMTFEEWVSKQDKNNLEFAAIITCHKTHPGFTLEEIKAFIYTTIIENENNQKIYEETFGQRHPNSPKLNQQMNKLFRIVFSPGNEFKSIDNRGHGDIISAQFGETNRAEGRKAEKIGFRIEEKAVRFAQDLIQHNIVGQRTIADLVRTGFSKYVEMIPIINELKSPIVDTFITEMKHEREEREKLKIRQAIEGFKQRVESQQKSMFDSLRYADNQEELEELRDWVVQFIKDALSYSAPTIQGRLQIKRFIQEDPSLYNMLTTLETRKLLPREYIDSVRQKGIAIPIVSLVDSDDTKLGR
jgi:hypothetical protein